MDDSGKKAGLVFSSATADRLARIAVIAEIGVNHDGDLGLGRGLIEAAAAAGADAVKFQYFHPDRLLSNQAELAGYQRDKASSQRALLEKLALSIDAVSALVSYARVCGLAAVVTPFSVPDVAELSGLGLDAVKLASPDAVNRPLLEACRGLGLPMLISTGTCELLELEWVAGMLRRHDAGGALLHCVSSYPTPMGAAQLGGVVALREAFGLLVGYSDHTRGLETGAYAVLAGAVVLEKHLTHDRSADGPDHAASLEPAELSVYIEKAHEAVAVLGPVAKTVSEIERDVRRVSRQSVCVNRDLHSGHVIGAGDLVVKRPGTGLPASELPTVIGRRLARSVRANDVLMPDDLT